MRRLFLFLLIALLPLRGWVGDTMAMEMAALKLNTTKLVANYSIPTWGKAHFDDKITAPAIVECSGHAAMAVGVAAASGDAVASANTVDAANDAHNGHCNMCNVCEICHTVALTQAVAVVPPGFIPQMLPAAGSIRFASALTALDQKPPIS